jgi:hypothetical protein
MTFALCPDDGYPRLWRFVAPGVLPENMLCELNKAQNLLVIDKEQFDRLIEMDQHRVLRTHDSIFSPSF